MDIGQLDWSACKHCENMTDIGCDIDNIEQHIEIDFYLDSVICNAYRMKEEYSDF